jgi:hypothetical protein
VYCIHTPKSIRILLTVVIPAGFFGGSSFGFTYFDFVFISLVAKVSVLLSRSNVAFYNDH